MSAIDMATRPIHLGLGATAEVEPRFTGDFAWYDAYAERHRGDGREGRLVSLFTFDVPWSSWEMHPTGAEVVLCTAGTLILHQEQADGTITIVRLGAGQYAINPPGVWHTADVEGPSTALFITAGEGTQHRPR
jgi:mannose-6-phosphate isomerase-like protein (cupin superfamily)